MPFVHGKNASIVISKADGTALDISGIANEVDMPISIDTAETSHFGSQAKTYITGLDDGTMSIKGMYDTATDALVWAAIDAIKNGTLDAFPVVFGPAGATTGKPKYTGNFLPTSYEVDAPVGDLVSFSMALQRSGATTRGNFA